MKPVIEVFGKASFFRDAPFVALEEFLIPRLIALGIGIGYVDECFDCDDEYLSSQKCPTCTRNVEMPNGIRIKYCRDYNIYFHRDTMTAQNQAIPIRSELFDGSIPIQFQRPSVSDTVPAPILVLILFSDWY